MSNGKDMMTHSLLGLIMKLNEILLYKSESVFPKPYEPFGWYINVKVDLSNYVKKSDLKNTTGVDTSKSAAKSDLVSLKTEVDKLDVDKLKKEPTNLSNLKSKVDKLDIGKLNKLI